MSTLIVFIVIIIIVIIFIVLRKRESLALPDDEIARAITAVIATQKSGGSVLDFTRANPSIAPVKYAQLVTLYKNGTLNIANARAVLA